MSKSFRGQAQKDFMRMFDSLTGAKSRYQIWTDMIWLIALAIQNSVEAGVGVKSRYWEEREKHYLEIISHYEKNKQIVFAQLFDQIVQIIDEKSAGDHYEDFLGDLFMQLELGNDAGGQFFTPYSVCEMSAECIFNEHVAKAEIEEKGFISINEPSCGAGAMLIAFMQVLKQHGINYQEHCLFVAQDIDSTTALMCYIQMSLLGCAGWVRIGNTLTDPPKGPMIGGEHDINTWYTPMWYSNNWQMRYTRELLHLPQRGLETLQQAPEPEPKPTFTLTEHEDGQMAMF